MKKYLLIFLLISSIGFAQKTTLWGIGDSTMANKQNPDRNPEFGWMQVFQPFFKNNIKNTLASIV